MFDANMQGVAVGETVFGKVLNGTSEYCSVIQPDAILICHMLQKNEDDWFDCSMLIFNPDLCDSDWQVSLPPVSEDCWQKFDNLDEFYDVLIVYHGQLDGSDHLNHEEEQETLKHYKKLVEINAQQQ